VLGYGSGLAPKTGQVSLRRHGLARFFYPTLMPAPVCTWGAGIGGKQAQVRR
jgi:hypothetical protein